VGSSKWGLYNSLKVYGMIPKNLRCNMWHAKHYALAADHILGGAVASWLVSLTPDKAVWVIAIAIATVKKFPLCALESEHPKMLI